MGIGQLFLMVVKSLPTWNKQEFLQLLASSANSHSLLGLAAKQLVVSSTSYQLDICSNMIPKLFLDIKVFHKTRCKLSRQSHPNTKPKIDVVLLLYPLTLILHSTAQKNNSSKVVYFTVLWDDICCPCHLICKKGVTWH